MLVLSHKASLCEVTNESAGAGNVKLLYSAWDFQASTLAGTGMDWN